MAATPQPSDNSLTRALAACRQAFGSVFVFSAVVNILMLTTSIYMMQVYDRVLASRSWDTLALLTLIAFAALGVMAAVDAVRARVMGRVGTYLEASLGPEAVERSIFAALKGSPYRSEALRDLGQVRTLIGGGGVFALFDSPWVPVYVLVIYLLHPALAAIAVAGSVWLFALAWANERWTRDPLRLAARKGMTAMRRVDAAHRNAEVVDAMGLARGLIGRWSEDSRAVLRDHERAADRAAFMLALTKFSRLGLQIIVLAAGAWLAVQQEISPGAMIAASILMSRAVAPVEQAIGAWRQVVGAREAYRRLVAYFGEALPRAHSMKLPAPKGHLAAEGVSYVPPGADKPVLRNVAFALEPGTVLGVVGPSGAGKSTLARLLVGVAKPGAGAVRLDAADVHAWNRDDVGRHIGYLPQDIELFAGTVKENIARMGEVDPAAVVAAANLAGVHEMILRMPAGYDTEIGEGGSWLSGGQRQRIGLARALYGEPRLVVLDEPNSNLDTEGEAALQQAVLALRRAGSTVVLITHRPNLIGAADNILVLQDGAVRMFGERERVLAAITPGRQARPPELRPGGGPAIVAQRDAKTGTP